MILRRGFVLAASGVALAALWTGARGGFYLGDMYGFFPPHRGYSAYIVSALLFLAGSRWGRGLAGAVLLLSGARAAWLGVLAGWAWGRPRRWAVAAILGALAVTGGLWLKPAHVRPKTDNVRRQIWLTTVGVIARTPRGVGQGNFCMGIAGREVTKAHSDVLQVLVEQGWLWGGLVIIWIAGAFWLTPPGVGKQVLVCLLAQSVIDNRLHQPACVVALTWVWAVAWLEGAQVPRV